jgi:soluble lytic murein transglycosylase
MLIFFLAIVVFSGINAGNATEELRAKYRQGREHMKEGQWEKSLEILIPIQKDYGLIRDYLLLDIAKCYEKLNDKEKALGIYEKVINDYKISPVYKKTFAKAVELKKEINPEAAIQLVNSYTKEFPGDDKGVYAKAEILKKLGREKDASELFAEVFRRGGSQTLSAHKELTQMGIKPSTADIEKAVKVLSQRGAYRDIVDLLDGADKKEEGIRYMIGNAYFRIKNYKEALRYLKGIYNRDAKILRASIHLRNGEVGEAVALIEELSKSGQKGLYDLYYRVAEIRRREGNVDDAEKRFKDMLKSYPDSGSQIRWSLAWLDIRRKNYAAAEKVLSELVREKSAEREKYIFWLGKLAVYQDKNGDAFFSQLVNDEGYYGLRAKGIGIKRSLPDTVNYEEIFSRLTEGLKTAYLRAAELSAVGMNAEASFEIRRVSDNIKREDIRLFATLLSKANDYKTPIALVGRDDSFLEFKYPFAYRDNVLKTAQEKNLDPFLTLSIMREESRFDTNAVSEAGALGLMQLMPATARSIIKIRHNDEIFDVEKNIVMGSSHLAYLIKRYQKLPLAIAAYNAGENRVDSWLTQGYADEDEFIDDIPFKETREYVKRVLKSYYIYKGLYRNEVKN